MLFWGEKAAYGVCLRILFLTVFAHIAMQWLDLAILLSLLQFQSSLPISS